MYCTNFFTDLHINNCFLKHYKKKNIKPTQICYKKYPISSINSQEIVFSKRKFINLVF